MQICYFHKVTCPTTQSKVLKSRHPANPQLACEASVGQPLSMTYRSSLPRNPDIFLLYILWYLTLRGFIFSITSVETKQKDALILLRNTKLHTFRRDHGASTTESFQIGIRIAASRKRPIKTTGFLTIVKNRPFPPCQLIQTSWIARTCYRISA